MSEKLSCHVVKDLLPLYVDGLTGGDTSEDIRSHLESCSDCSAVFNAMTDEGEEQDKKQTEAKQKTKEIDYLKKIKNRGRRIAAVVGCAALLIAAIILIRVYVIGNDVDQYLNVSLPERIAIKASSGGQSVNVSVRSDDLRTAVARILFSEDDGVVTVRIKAVPALIYKSEEVHKTWRASSDVKKIIGPGGIVLWEDGKQIDELARCLFAAKTPYAGDNVAVGKILGLSEWLTGPYHTSFELHTASEPYGIKTEITSGAHRDEYGNTFNMAEFRCTETEIPYMENNYRRQACLMLACVDNLGYFEYYAKPDNLNLVIEGRITAEEAYEYVKSLAGDRTLGVSDIKGFSKSASLMQDLVEILGYPHWDRFAEQE